MEQDPDQLAVVQHIETKLWHGAYYRNKPTPSGCTRYILQATTTQGFKTEDEAALAIETAFPDMPKVTALTMGSGVTKIEK